MVPTVPAAIGKYSIEREIGRGASSTVYLGFDRFVRRAVAIKQIHPHLLADQELARRYLKALRNEASVAGQLNHPHIVRLLDRPTTAADLTSLSHWAKPVQSSRVEGDRRDFSHNLSHW